MARQKLGQSLHRSSSTPLSRHDVLEFVEIPEGSHTEGAKAHGEKGAHGIIYPGLESHPQHALATRQMDGFGGIVTIVVRGGLAETRRMLEQCNIFALAESLGGVESLINHPAIMTHASVPVEKRDELGISDSLVRLSVGIEQVEDLMADLDQALAASVVY